MDSVGAVGSSLKGKKEDQVITRDEAMRKEKLTCTRAIDLALALRKLLARLMGIESCSINSFVYQSATIRTGHLALRIYRTAAACIRAQPGQLVRIRI